MQGSLIMMQFDLLTPFPTRTNMSRKGNWGMSEAQIGVHRGLGYRIE